MNSQNEYDNSKDCDSVKYKDKKCPIEASEDTSKTSPEEYELMYHSQGQS